MPTAKTLLLELPHTSRRSWLVPLTMEEPNCAIVVNDRAEVTDDKDVVLGCPPGAIKILRRSG